MNKILIIIFCVILLGCKPQNEATPHYNPSSFINQNWAMDKLWEDGQAEVAIYDAQFMIYGQARKFDAPVITVKEEFNKGFNVKTDDYSRDDLFSVIKINRFADIPTPSYPYHFLTSIFIQRDKPEQVYKMTHTGQEWCGNTFKQFELSSAGYQYDYNSYFDGYGDGKMEIDGNDFWWEDQLPYVLRALNFDDGLSFSKEVMSTEINTKTRKPTFANAAFKVVDQDSLWQVTVTYNPEKTNTYTFQKAYPNLMTSQKTWYGFDMELKSVSRYKYWR